MAKGPKSNTVSPTILAQLASLSGAPQMLTADEGAAVVAAGFATVDPTTLQDGKCLVTITEAGTAALAGANVTEKVVTEAKVKPVFAIRNDIVMPTKVRKTKEAIYPLATMEVGQSFHIPATAENPDPALRIQSTLSSARVRFMVKSETENETVTVKNYIKGEDGKIKIDADGHRVFDGSTQVTRPKETLGRDFAVAPVDASDPEGPGARVWRTV